MNDTGHAGESLTQESVELRMNAHKCNPLIVSRWFCPCGKACALYCFSCGDVITFVRDNSPMCEHMAAVKSGPRGLVADWWGGRGLGYPDGSKWRLRG